MERVSFHAATGYNPTQFHHRLAFLSASCWIPFMLDFCLRENTAAAIHGRVKICSARVISKQPCATKTSTHTWFGKKEIQLDKNFAIFYQNGDLALPILCIYVYISHQRCCPVSIQNIEKKICGSGWATACFQPPQFACSKNSEMRKWYWKIQRHFPWFLFWANVSGKPTKMNTGNLILNQSFQIKTLWFWNNQTQQINQTKCVFELHDAWFGHRGLFASTSCCAANHLLFEALLNAFRRGLGIRGNWSATVLHGMVDMALFGDNFWAWNATSVFSLNGGVLISLAFYLASCS